MKYIFLAITCFCSSYFIEKEINDLKLLYLCYLVVLLREVTAHIKNRLRNLVGLIGKEILKKGDAMEKSTHELQKGEFEYLCVRKK